MSSSEKTFPEDFDILQAIQNCLEAPEWQGFAIPYPDKIRRFFLAGSIVNKLVRNAPNVIKVFDEPKPFHQDCGGQITIYCDELPYAFAVFQNRKAIDKVSEFLNLIDSVTISAETANDEPVIVIRWEILDVFQKLET